MIDTITITVENGGKIPCFLVFSAVTISEVKCYMEFIKENISFLGFSEVSVSALRREQDPEVRDTIIEAVENGGKTPRVLAGFQAMLSFLKLTNKTLKSNRK